MIRKCVSPIVFFLFGMTLGIVLSSIELPVDRNDISHNGVNLFVRIIIIIVFGLLCVFDVRVQFKSIQKITYKYIYLTLTVLLLAAIGYFWMQYLTLK